MRSDVVHPEAVHITDGRAQADGTRHMGRASFKFVGQLVVDRLLEGHRTDHVATALVRRHGIQQSGFAIKNADAGRTIYLVTGENVEVAIQSLDVHFEMRHSLGPIDQHRDVPAMCHFDNALDRSDRPQRVGDVCYGYNFRSRSQQVFKVFEQQLAAVADWCNSQPCTLLFAQDLPGHNVGVMLHGGDEHFVAGVNVSAAVGLRHEVDTFRGATNKDDLARISALRKPCTVLRDASYSSVACSERKCTPRWMLALSR